MEEVFRSKWSVVINGKEYDARWPLCGGCPELIISGGCSSVGDGCNYPDRRAKRPPSMYLAFLALCKTLGKSPETVCDELGS